MSRADIVIGLGNGDEGKGAWVAHLVEKHNAAVVCRFNGGAQAGHQAFTEDGREHIFSQFGSGMFVPGVITMLSRFMLIEPQALFTEASLLATKGVSQPLERLVVSENAPIVGPYNRMLNRITEVYRGSSRHGSCGYGIGVTQEDVETLGDSALRVKDLRRDGGLKKMRALLELKIARAERFRAQDTERMIEGLKEIDLTVYADLFLRFYHQVSVVSEPECREILRGGRVVFEGAQGVLLDQDYGFFPHCTRSRCTFSNALTLLEEAGFTGEIFRTGLLRAYGTRHGAGPFPTEDPLLEAIACHNHFNEWQGEFRTGWFDAVLARFALEVVGHVDTFGVTCLDRISGREAVKIGATYQCDCQLSPDGKRLEIIKEDLDRLSARTRLLSAVSPQYEVVPGFNCAVPREVERYLDALSGLVGQKVNAYSISPTQKLYR